MKKALFTTLLAIGITSAIGGQAMAAAPEKAAAQTPAPIMQIHNAPTTQGIIAPELTWDNCSYGPASYSFYNSLTVQKKMSVHGGGTYGNGTVRVVFSKAAYFYVKLTSSEGNSTSYYMNGETSHYFYNMKPSTYTCTLSDDGQALNTGSITMYWDGDQN